MQRMFDWDVHFCIQETYPGHSVCYCCVNWVYLCAGVL
jgi:hypothetical protein